VQDKRTDNELLVAAMEGDEPSFVALYERHRGVVYRFAYRMVQSDAAAEDISQDCFLELIKHPLRFNSSRATLRTFLLAITRNLALTYIRKRSNEVLMDELPEAEVSHSHSPVSRLIMDELVGMVREAVAKLPVANREALILFEYEELSLKEIAEIVGEEVGTVKARIYRARQNIRESLASYMEGTSHEVEESKR
jgi:RNA polymerase sigma-70 factor, ECF subfamily